MSVIKIDADVTGGVADFARFQAYANELRKCPRVVYTLSGGTGPVSNAIVVGDSVIWQNLGQESTLLAAFPDAVKVANITVG